MHVMYPSFASSSSSVVVEVDNIGRGGNTDENCNYKIEDRIVGAKSPLEPPPPDKKCVGIEGYWYDVTNYIHKHPGKLLTKDGSQNWGLSAHL